MQSIICTQAVPQACPSRSSKELMGAKLDASLHSDLPATAERLKSQRSSSVGTARGNIRTTKSDRVVGCSVCAV
jgi:hypothetical protein